ncbi:MAG: ATP-binding cassette domain-containing protein [Acidimicrobiales bacterium]|nr:ATP-binding cassette domain-containing protein [Acidimicrobiales bacterium]
MHSHAGGFDGIAVCAQHLDIGHEGRMVVGDLHLEVPAGTTLAIVGTNGSGKSTFLKTVVGLLDPLEGRLEVFGEPPGRQPARVAYLSQFHASAIVLPLRAADVVRMGRFAHHGLLGRLGPADRTLVDSSLAAMGVERLAHAPLRSLSGGQQQRIYLAQVLARGADLLLLDEPAAGLDAVGRELYLDAVTAERERGAAVVTATHDIGEAAHADQVLLLARRVIAIGRPDDVLTEANLLETFGIVLSRVGGRLMVAERDHHHDALPSER